jgi:hypothetical protein
MRPLEDLLREQEEEIKAYKRKQFNKGLWISISYLILLGIAAYFIYNFGK